MKQDCPSAPFPPRLLPPSLPAPRAPKPCCATVSLLGTAEGAETSVNGV